MKKSKDYELDYSVCLVIQTRHAIGLLHKAEPERKGTEHALTVYPKSSSTHTGIIFMGVNSVREAIQQTRKYSSEWEENKGRKNNIRELISLLLEEI